MDSGTLEACIITGSISTNIIQVTSVSRHGLMLPRTRLELLPSLMSYNRATTKFWGRESSLNSLSS
ncbi:hypothetical protein LEMLEM_LOCUS18934 [Lemmus lemmus]